MTKKLVQENKLLFIVSLLMLLFVSSLGISAQEKTALIIGTGDFSYQDGDYTNAEFRFPYGLASSPSKDVLYIVDNQNHRIRTLDIAAKRVATLAGNSELVDRFGFPAGGHRDGDAAKAMFNRPRGIAVAPNGAIFIADTGNHAIRKVYDGKVYTVAGNGTPGYKNDNGIQALFNNPSSIAINSTGEIFVSDTLNHSIRKIDREGTVTTYVGSPNDSTILNEPAGIAFDKDDVLYIVSSADHQIKRVNHGRVELVAGSVSEIDKETNYWVGGNIDGLGKNARLNFPKGITYSTEGYFFIADAWNHSIKAVSPEGRVFTVAGAGVSGSDWDQKNIIRFDGPFGIHCVSDTLYIADYWNNRIVSIPVTNEMLRPAIDFALKKSQLPVYIDGSELKFPDVQPVIVEGRTRVPVRFIAEQWGADVSWDNTRKAVIVSKNGKIVEFFETTGDFYVQQGRSMVQLRTLAENLGFSVDWVAEHRAVVIETSGGK
ncbi:hypothetical protein BHU72_04115 [Desulfuribacillus stibiiarsenatis]|uniref:Copper amine oxidase-like N-terminal domain-containing protein n=1 Tax=Desulfuribacillus stibiiarsenatis TaxID=1390249 RepID=A0A1E5L5N5_9FIRM|nr:stalk domain-containing protein [Desulfuribacillus stibiiarsenatis]OEH85289.1 hypothetical protein BHU72_04115 [Desulfuribacillus stibiiarsenatis]